MYKNSEELEKLFKEAKKNAQKGDANAQYNLGKMYFYGEGYFRDYNKALKWLEKSALQNDKRALFKAGLMYLKDDSEYKQDLEICEDRKKAIKYLEKSSELGCVKACFKMAEIHIDGRYVLKSPKSASKFIKLAFEIEPEKAMSFWRHHNLYKYE